MISEEEAAKKEWTEQERLELAAKLDAELDVFINSLEKKRYEEGWPEDRWQEVTKKKKTCKLKDNKLSIIFKRKWKNIRFS